MKEGMSATEKKIEEKIFSTFGEVATGIGYSSLHGKIIAVLLVKGKPLSLPELAKSTGYSSSTISLSLDFLELLGVIKRIKVSADRKLYIQLQGDLLEALKKGIIIRLKKSISDSLGDFTQSKQDLQKLGGKNQKQLLKTIKILEKEIKRLEKYVELLNRISLP